MCTGKDDSNRGQSAGKDIVKDTNLSWLAGIWEGEGSILLYSRPVNEKRIQITPALEITNTDIHIINECRRLLEELNCNFSYMERRSKKTQHKITYTLRTQNAVYIKNVLENILPYMIGVKKAYGETLLSFVKRRLEKCKEQNKTLKQLNYDEEDFEFVRSSTTTREDALSA